MPLGSCYVMCAANYTHTYACGQKRARKKQQHSSMSGHYKERGNFFLNPQLQPMLFKVTIAVQSNRTVATTTAAAFRSYRKQQQQQH